MDYGGNGNLRSDPRGNATRPNELRAPRWDPQGARGHRWQFPNRDRRGAVDRGRGFDASLAIRAREQRQRVADEVERRDTPALRLDPDVRNPTAWLARRLSQHKQLRPGVTIAEAAHVLWIAASFEAFDLLYTGRGLSADETARILIENTERAICR